MKKLIYAASLLFLLGCASEKEISTPEALINQAIVAHGMNNLNHAAIKFTFRDKTYTASRDGGSYRYTRSFIEDSSSIQDILINSQEFYRIVAGDTLSLADSMATKYASSINSVLYFVQLPYLLKDPAVNASYQGLDTLNGERYHVLKVTFDAAGGGEDHEDEYRYWFHEQTHHMDFLAYSYETDGGGVRFREAYNRQTTGGISFQDYVNYKAPKDTPLSVLPTFYSRGQLKKLSVIENKGVHVTNK